MSEQDESWLTMRRAEVISVEMNAAQLREEAAQFDRQRAQQDFEVARERYFLSQAPKEWKVISMIDETKLAAEMTTASADGWEAHSFTVSAMPVTPDVRDAFVLYTALMFRAAKPATKEGT